MSQVARQSDTSASMWIMSPACDLTLLIATPLAIIPAVFLLARQSFAPEQIALGVFAFASLGHHLPGLMRAYGDRELFLRYKWRFLIAPPLAIAASWLFFVSLRLHGLEVILLFWATWHILMQTYGFMRIYDMKLGRTSAWDARLDLWVCLAVFASGVVFSDARVIGIAESLWLTGIPVFGVELLTSMRWLIGIGTAVLLAVYFTRSLKSWRHSAGVNWLKLLLLLSTALLYWTAGRLAVNVLIGVAMFEIFHAVQYYAIVWFYNRRRSERVGDAFGPLGLLFGGNWWGLPVYVAAICAFGALGFWGRTGDPTNASAIALALFSASAMLHFYYDGFIWKVSQHKTGENLNLPDAPSQPARRPAYAHAVKWSVLAILLLSLTALEQSHQPNTPAEQQRRLTALMKLTPDLPELQTQMSIFSSLRGDKQQASEAAEKAVKLRPRSYDAQMALGHASADLARWKTAENSFAIASDLRPQKAEALFGLALARVQTRNFAAARFPLETCLRLEPNHVQARFQLGNVYHFTRQPENAIECYRQCTKLKPEFADAYFNLGTVLFETDNLTESAAAYAKTVRLRPNYATAHYHLGQVLYRQGKDAEARRSINRAEELGQIPK